MIEIKHLRKQFKDNLIFDNLNLKIEKGEFIAIIGPSGSGKSTLLNLIAALDTPDKGKISINKQEISQLKDREASLYRNKEIGFIFQEFHLEAFLNVEENILLPTQFHKGAKVEKSLKSLLKEVGLEDKAQAKPKEISGGQKQRVAIARALINQPKIILADEPTGNLDPKTSKQIIKLLKDLHKKHQVTLIVATHDAEIAKAANRTININDL